jgi:integrin alpha FG-GAP repeat containing protein 1
VISKKKHVELKPWQPFVADIDGSLRPQLIAQKFDSNLVQSWMYSLDAEQDFVPQDIVLDPSDRVCEISHPHSNSFLDLDGDCLADLFLLCENRGKKSFQIWINQKDRGFRLHSTTELPQGVGQISFADMDADGAVDMVYPSCVDNKCSIHVVYNKQMGLCGHSMDRCREPHELCTSDPQFSFALNSSSVRMIDLVSHRDRFGSLDP